MRPFLVTWIATLALLFTGSARAQPFSCETLLRAALTHDASIERSILDSVSPQAIKDNAVSKLASDVFLLTLADGNAVVLRTASESANPAFEDFAARLVREMPGLGTPLVKKLTGTELRGYLPLLRRAGFAPGVKMSEATDTKPMATLAVYFPGLTWTLCDDTLAWTTCRSCATCSGLRGLRLGRANQAGTRPIPTCAGPWPKWRLVPRSRPQIAPTTIKTAESGPEKLAMALVTSTCSAGIASQKTCAATRRLLGSLTLGADFHQKLARARGNGRRSRAAIGLALKSRDFAAAKASLRSSGTRPPTAATSPPDVPGAARRPHAAGAAFLSLDRATRAARSRRGLRGEEPRARRDARANPDHSRCPRLNCSHASDRL